jgi:hypothetical protein
VTTSLNGQTPYEFVDREGPLPAGQIALWASGDTVVEFRSIAVKEFK